MTRLQTRIAQAVVMTVGIVAAVVMIFLGLWQMQVFHNQGHDAAVARLKESPVPLGGLVTPGHEVTTDAYGRAVSTEGSYLPDMQILIPVPESPGRFRVLTALQRRDGSIVPVVRGVTSTTTAPAPPSGYRHEHGAFLASEPEVAGDLPPGQLGSVRLSALAGMWQHAMVPGFITLTPEVSTTDHHLTAAPLYLPQTDGPSRNAGYALQWWVFSAAGLVFCWYISHDLGRKLRTRELAAAGLVQQKEQDQ